MSRTTQLRDIQLEKLTSKYTQAETLVDMIKAGSTPTILNPAYNTEFKDWVTTIKKDMSESAVITLDKGTSKVSHTYELAGAGGVGSNILYMLENFNHEYEGTKFKQPFFEFDEWDYSNLPRIPVKPAGLKKSSTFIDEKLGSYSDNEDDIGQPVFLLACQMDIINTTFFGAFDIETRKQYYTAKIPFIGITHRDNTLNVILNPEPITDEDLSVETYGIVDVNFFIPAALMSGIFMYLLQTKLSEKLTVVDSLISEYKEKKYTQQFIDIYSSTEHDTHADIIEAYIPKTAKYKSAKAGSKEEPLLVAKEVFAELFNLLHTPEGRQDILDNVPTAQDIVPDSPEIQEITSLWDKMNNKTLMSITQKNVDVFLKCSNTQEALDYVDSLVSEIL